MKMNSTLKDSFASLSRKLFLAEEWIVCSLGIIIHALILPWTNPILAVVFGMGYFQYKVELFQYIFWIQCAVLVCIQIALLVKSIFYRRPGKNKTSSAIFFLLFLYFSGILGLTVVCFHLSGHLSF